MNNNGQSGKRRLLTAFDIVIIAAVIVIAALFLMWRASKSAPAAADGAPPGGNVTFTIELSEMENTDGIAEGDELIETVKNTNIGTVKTCEVTNMLRWSNNLETGGITVSETDMKTVYLTVEAPCTITNSTIATKAGAFEIRVGTFVGIAGPGYWGRGYIVSVERS